MSSPSEYLRTYVVVYALVCPGSVLVRIPIDTITTVTVVGKADAVIVTV